MATQPLRFTNFDGLLNIGVADFLRPDNELSACKNVFVNKLGLLEKVPGYTQAGDTIAATSISPSVSPSLSPSLSPSTSISPSISFSVSPSVSPSSSALKTKNITGLHWYYQPSTRINYMLATANNAANGALQLFYRTTGNLTELTDAETAWDTYEDAEPNFCNFIDKCFIVGYDSTDNVFLPKATITGTTFSTADGNLTNMPLGKYLARYRDRIYVGYTKEGSTIYPSRVYFSSIPTAGTITWTVATDFVEFGYDDGDEITGIAEAYDRLVVWKHHSMWYYDESERKQISDIGCDSAKSIVKIGSSPYWFNREGFWRWTGGVPQLISAKAQDFIEAIDQSALSSVVAGQYGFEYRAYIGTITLGNDVYTNAWFCFNTKTEKQYIRCTADTPKCATNYVESGKRRLYFGADDGNIYKFATPIDKIYADDDADIDSFFITNNFHFGVPEQRKETINVTVFSKYAKGLNIVADKDNYDQFELKVGQIQTNIESFDPTIEANRIRFKFYETSQDRSWQFEGFTVDTGISSKR